MDRNAALHLLFMHAYIIQSVYNCQIFTHLHDTSTIIRLLITYSADCEISKFSLACAWFTGSSQSRDTCFVSCISPQWKLSATLYPVCDVILGYLILGWVSGYIAMMNYNSPLDK